MISKKPPLASDSRDRLSGLPDALLYKILSFINMTSAIQNSILSKRWRYLWKSPPTLKFNSYDMYQKSFRNLYMREEGAIVYFIDHVLARRERSDIRRLDIVIYDVKFDFGDHLYSWIHAAVDCNVQELSIEIWDNQQVKIPPSLFTCTSLTKFELAVNGRHNYGEIFLPDAIYLPRLKCLKFEGLGFEDEDSTDKFFSKCPNLESLTMVDTYIEFDICCPNLEVFIMEFNDLRCPMATLQDGQRNPGGKDWYNIGNTIKLSAPKLTFLTCKGLISEDNIIENLSSLKTADIDIKLLEDMRWYHKGVEEEDSGLSSAEDVESGKLMGKFLSALSDVKFLTLSHIVLKV
ncbi:F-box/FBD/LRR-repeat protein At1g16930-like [Papaver somniferum]|uniref:F-box/FBD/LRR-repeat protein At1g16930-like n=1 Tax=Papaver somniferum TaxID=3469 RepID=UPI000E6FFA14|nr:F-box/FBD/LRR-repeat protein At1g16930-like [Papaver somniferum]